ncbi:hypothetical protein CERZMDRAFT_87160 [Cercospora zeae-maydis SCOH1-5]|uniref:Uncharacterized protein n=1 Tax=Cercospora zeae-maydis SCOH1-5 TaxID=717836 RepID=A0A6A6F407_9PEZI|nr:hypothetical protein CERZMDRAFT_87160 [Cercospora zeae-maydis SCOH1-5]
MSYGNKRSGFGQELDELTVVSLIFMLAFGSLALWIPFASTVSIAKTCQQSSSFVTLPLEQHDDILPRSWFGGSTTRVALPNHAAQLSKHDGESPHASASTKNRRINPEPLPSIAVDRTLLADVLGASDVHAADVQRQAGAGQRMVRDPKAHHFSLGKI